MKTFAAALRGVLNDPYILCTVGSLLLLRGLKTITEQAEALQQQIAEVQQQWVHLAARASSPPPAAANGAASAADGVKLGEPEPTQA